MVTFDGFPKIRHDVPDGFSRLFKFGIIAAVAGGIAMVAIIVVGIVILLT